MTRPDNNRPDANRPDANRPDANRPGEPRRGAGDNPGRTPDARPLDPNRRDPGARNPEGRNPDRTPGSDRDPNMTDRNPRNRDLGGADDHPGLTRPRTGAADQANRAGAVRQLRINPQQFQNDAAVQAAVRDLRNVRNVNQLDQAFSSLKSVDRNSPLAALPLDRVAGRFQANVRADRYSPIFQSKIGQRYNLDRQFQLYTAGDVARQMALNTALVTAGGWDTRLVGPIYSGYTNSAFSVWYPGPQWYPTYAWAPVWSPWVSWSFWNTVSPIYDPRPFVVRPYVYDPAPVVTVYDYPTWTQLPVVVSGTWVDVPAAPVSAGQDLQLLAVRFVDPGHPEENLGPRYRVWLRNNANADLTRNVDVTLFASEAKELSNDVVQSGVRVPEIAANDTIAVDIRLPLEANRLATNDESDHVPFRYLHVVVDSRNELKEANEDNNGALLSRAEIYQVDPAAFSTNVTVAAPGSVISLAGEGFGPEPGEVIVSIGDRQERAEIRGWYDLGVQITVPNVDVASLEKAEVLVIRGDGAASNPVPLDVAPEDSIGTVAQTELEVR